METDKETVDKLKGDAIGSTSYTQRFVLKTILQLKEPEWNDELEQDLCFLWDATIEKDVCQYLMEIDFPTIACNVILQFTEGAEDNERLVEILVGILSNILIVNTTAEFDTKHTDVILNLLFTNDDPLTLIQAIRFIVGTFTIERYKSLFKEEQVKKMKDVLQFILENSTSTELVEKTLQLLSKIEDKVIFDSTLVLLAVSACQRMITEEGEKDFEVLVTEQHNLVKFTIEYIVNFCTFLEESTENWQTCLDLLNNLIGYFSLQENLLPITNEISYYFEASGYIIKTLKLPYAAKLLSNIFKVVDILIRNDCLLEEQSVAEIFCHLLSLEQATTIKTQLKGTFETNDIKRVCDFFQTNKANFKFEYDDKILHQLY